MTVVFIYPHFKVVPYNGVAEPLGVLYIISTLRNAGYNDVHFINMTFVEQYSDINETLKDADIIGVTCTSPSLHWHVKSAIDHARKVNPEAIMISGGSHSTMSTEDLLNLGFDYVFQGESEISMVEFLQTIENGNDPGNVRGIAYMKNGSTVINERADIINNLDSIPFPARDLIDYEKYCEHGLTEYGMVTLRGCPYKCLYCQPTIKTLFGKLRKRSAENVVDEIQELINMRGQGIRIFFKDETIGLHGEKWFFEFRDLIKRRKLEFTWHCNTRVNTITEKMLEAMRDAGCICISFS